MSAKSCLYMLLAVISCPCLIYAAPITLDTALPVTEGEGIIRVQASYISSTNDPSSQNRKLTVSMSSLALGYGMTDRLAVFAIAPIIDKELKSNAEKRDSSGLGDISLITRYTLWKSDRQGETLRVAPFAAIKTPTGNDNEKDSMGRLPQPLQPGSGSWDPSIGVILTSQTLQRQIDASASYTFNTKANDFKFGDMARFDLSYQHRLWPRALEKGVPAFVYGVMESNLIWQGKNEADGVDDSNSGGTTWYLTPGIQYVTKRSVVEGAVQIPVVQELNGDALKNDFVGIISFRANF